MRCFDCLLPLNVWPPWWCVINGYQAAVTRTFHIMTKLYDGYGVFFAEEGETMLEGHLVAHVYEKLKGDKQCLELNKVFTTFDLKLVCEKKTTHFIQFTCLQPFSDDSALFITDFHFVRLLSPFRAWSLKSLTSLKVVQGQMCWPLSRFWGSVRH